METVSSERKLAAIMVADIVGYSRLMEADEAGTLAAMAAVRRDVLDPNLAKRHGRIVKLLGDGLIAEFGSIVDAVACAVAVQHRVAEHQTAIAASRRIVFRIGVNLGDVVIEGDDLLGDGVNIAARLEQLCDPGGVLVSGTAYDHLQGKLDVPLEDAGEHHVKNIKRPVRAYRVRLDGSVQRFWPGLRRVRRLLTFRVAAVLAVVALVTTGWWWLQPRQAAANEASVAVLPFANMSGDPSQDYFGRAVAEEVITALSTFPTIRVVSRMSSFVYDKPVKVQDVARDLGVRYVLEGSARKDVDRARVIAQLIDAQTGVDVWADKYDSTGSDVVALQEDLADKLYRSIAGLKGKVRQDEERQAWRKDPPSLTEYDYYLRGHQLLMIGTHDDVLRARKLWEEGLNRFPDSILLKIKLGFTYTALVTEQWSADPKKELEAAWRIASEAANGSNKSRLETWLGHWLMAQLYAWHIRDYERAANEAEAAVQMVPYDTMSRGQLVYIVASAGRTEEAIAWQSDVIRREPHPSAWQFANLAWAYYVAGRSEEALAASKMASGTWLPWIAAIDVRLGRVEDARGTMVRFARETPNFKLQDEAWYTPAPKSVLEPYLNDLRVAGMPE